jgi:tRNA threonylcarbamoyladenosine biosynthesis protein TsaB
MLTLGIDTATRTGGVALVNDGRILCSRSCPLRLTHSESLMPVIAEVLEEVNDSLSNIQAVAVAVGPGSFTGLRVGLATAKGLCVGRGIPVVGVPTMEALALPFRGEELPVWVLLPSRREHVYSALFQWVVKDGGWEPRRVRAERNQRVEEFLSELNQASFVAGPGLRNLEEEVLAVGGDLVRVDPRSHRDSDGSGVALLGEERALAGEGLEPRQVRPLYVVEQVAKPLPKFAAENGSGGKQ